MSTNLRSALMGGQLKSEPDSRRPRDGCLPFFSPLASGWRGGSRVGQAESIWEVSTNIGSILATFQERGEDDLGREHVAAFFSLFVG